MAPVTPYNANWSWWRAWCGTIARQAGKVHSAICTFDKLSPPMDPEIAARRALATWGINPETQTQGVEPMNETPVDPLPAGAPGPDPMAALEAAIAANPEGCLMMWDDKGHVALNWPMIERYAQAWRLGVRDHSGVQWCYALVSYRDQVRAKAEAEQSAKVPVAASPGLTLVQ